MSHPHTSVLYCHVNLHTCLFTTYLLLHLASHCISLVPLTTSYHLPLAASHCLCLSLPITTCYYLHLNKATLCLSLFPDQCIYPPIYHKVNETIHQSQPPLSYSLK